MRTSELIDVLATGAGPVPRAPAARRLVPVALGGTLAAAAVAIGLLGLVPEPMLSGTALWSKLVYSGLLAAAFAWLAARLSRPASPTAAPWRAAVALVGLMGLIAVIAIWREPGGERLSYLFGHSWAACPWNVLGLSVPALAGALWALRGLAPTRPRLAGLAAGLFAGSVGAFGYSMACPEVSLAFVAVWYSLGIVLTGIAGAVLGPRVLRW